MAAKIRVLGIAPYLGLKKLLEQAVLQYPDLELVCEVGDLEPGLEIAEREIAVKDFDLVISRGGTATLLKQHLTLPVIDVGVSQYDIMQMLQASREYMGKRALVGFESITTSAGTVAEILQDDIAIFTIHHKNDVHGLLEVLKAEGFDTVLGDMITTRAAKAVGLNYVQVVSSSESIERSLSFARLLGLERQQMKQQLSYYTRLLDWKNSALLIYNHKMHVITYRNSQTPQLLRVQKKLQLDSLKTQVIEADGHVYVAEKQVFDDAHYLISIGEKAFLHVNGAVSERETESVHFSSFDMFYRITEEAAFFEQIASYSKRDDIVFLTGEAGCGLDYAAELVQQNSVYPSDTWYEIDCRKVTDRELRQWLGSADSFFYDTNKVIHWKNSGALSMKQLTKLFLAIRDTSLVTRNKIVFSFQVGAQENLVSQQQIEQLFEESLSLLHIALAPLRKRSQYIPNLATIYINKLNRQYERQVVGFDKETLQALQLYPWPGNYGEFKRVIKESFYLAGSMYIKMAQLEQVIKMDRAAQGDQQKWLPYQPGETLAELISALINVRLQEPGMTKTKLADELGISRTTLWRYLSFQ